MDRTWRDADLRGAGAVPGTVDAVLRHAHVALSALWIGEAVLFAAAAGCLTLAAGVLSGVSLTPGAWIVAGLCAVCAGASWWSEARLEPRDLARRLDRRMRFQGALVAAWECERQGVETPMAQWLSRRVRRRLRTREATGALRPPIAAPIVAPLVGVALLALALRAVRADHDPAADLPRRAGALVERVERAASLALASSREGRLDAASARSLVELERRVRRFERDLGQLEPGEVRRRLASIQDELERLAPRVEGQPQLAAGVHQARTWLDGLRLELEGLAPAGSAALDPGPAGALRPGSSPESLSADGAVAEGRTDGTMSGSIPEPKTPAIPPGAEAGTSAGRFWAPEFDDVVALWIEARRRELEDPNGR